MQISHQRNTTHTDPDQSHPNWLHEIPRVIAPSGRLSSALKTQKKKAIPYCSPSHKSHTPVFASPIRSEDRRSRRIGKITLRNHRTMKNFRPVVSRLLHAKNAFHTAGANHGKRSFSLASGGRTCQASFTTQIRVRWLSSNEPVSHVVLEMPALSPTMNQGNITKWRKKEGDKLNTGDVICEIETDKATIEFESLEEGYLAKILIPEGSNDVPVGQPIAITVEDRDDIKNVPASVSNSSEKKEAKQTRNDAETAKEKGPSETKFSRISPAAKLLITEFGVDTSSLNASGPRGTLLKGDVLAAIKSGPTSSRTTSPGKSSTTAPPSQPAKHSPVPQERPAPSLLDAYEDLPNSQIRKVIAKRLVESKQSTPHLYISKDVNLNQLLAFRSTLKEQHNVKVSINDIIIKAVAVALKNVPEANAFWNDEKGEASSCDAVDISIAVATDKGLMTPIVRNADQKSLSAISVEVKELAEKARNGKLAPNQFQGGTFSISNLGMFPVDQFSAIINPPQAGILAVGRANKVVEPTVGDDGIEKPAVVTKMNLNLSADNRVFDTEIGGKFLDALSANISDVHRLLL